jgi:hypothetical protein
MQVRVLVLEFGKLVVVEHRRILVEVQELVLVLQQQLE